MANILVQVSPVPSDNIFTPAVVFINESYSVNWEAYFDSLTQDQIEHLWPRITPDEADLPKTVK